MAPTFHLNTKQPRFLENRNEYKNTCVHGVLSFMLFIIQYNINNLIDTLEFRYFPIKPLCVMVNNKQTYYGNHMNHILNMGIEASKSKVNKTDPLTNINRYNKKKQVGKQ